MSFEDISLAPSPGQRIPLGCLLARGTFELPETKHTPRRVFRLAQNLTQLLCRAISSQTADTGSPGISTLQRTSASPWSRRPCFATKSLHNGGSGPSPIQVSSSRPCGSEITIPSRIKSSNRLPPWRYARTAFALGCAYGEEHHCFNWS